MKIENSTNPGLASKSSFIATKAGMSGTNLQKVKTDPKPARILVTFGAMIRFLFSFFFLLFFSPALSAQTASDSIQKGVVADPRLQTLVAKHDEVNTHKKAKGYRVQIYFGADKTKANEQKAKFLGRYPNDINAYEVYEVPNFKVRVGDFRTRLEAYRFLKKIRAEFPSAFIVESEIEYPE